MAKRVEGKSQWLKRGGFDINEVTDLHRDEYLIANIIEKKYRSHHNDDDPFILGIIILPQSVDLWPTQLGAHHNNTASKHILYFIR